MGLRDGARLETLGTVEFFAMQGNSGDSTEVAGPAAGTSLRTFFRTYEYLFQSQEKLMANPFVHIELNTTDINQAKAFYGKLFDWKLEDVPMGEGSYTMINVGEGTGGGMTKQMTPGAPSAWLSYQRRRHRGCHQEGQVAGRKGGARCHGGDGSGLAQHHRRSHRRASWTVEGENPLARHCSKRAIRRRKKAERKRPEAFPPAALD